MRVAIAFVFAVLCAWDSSACSCVSLPLKYAFKRSQSIFIGEVVTIERTDDLQATFRVLESFKGSNSVGGKVTVHTPLWGETCGIAFTPGRYLIDADTDSRGYVRTGLCSHTQQLGSDRSRRAVQLLRSRGWWWRMPLSYPGRYPFRSWYLRHF